MTLRLEFHERTDTVTCPSCRGDYRRVFGTIFEDERRWGLYSADLHQHESDRRVLLALGTQCWNEGAQAWEKCSVTIEIWPTEDQFQMVFRDAEQSPYAQNGVLGRVQGREEARANPMRDQFFHVADHIVDDDSRINDHLNAVNEN